MATVNEKGVDMIYGPQIDAITIFARYHDLLAVERDYIADFGAAWLFPRTSFVGRSVAALSSPFEWLGWSPSRNTFDTVVRTTKVALEQLKNHLLHCPDTPSTFVSTCLALSFEERWRAIFRDADHLLTGSTAFPTFEKAQRVVAPVILEGITKAAIPWEIFESILKQRSLDRLSQRRLTEWVGDVTLWGSLISPLLLLSVCEAASQRTFPKLTVQENSRQTFFLAWKLYQAGLTMLVKPDESFPEIAPASSEAFEIRVKAQVGEQLQLSFPFDFPVTAYRHPFDRDLMVIQSPALAFLGIWACMSGESPSYVPCLQPSAMEYRSRFLIVERLTNSLEGNLWEGEFRPTPHDKLLLNGLSELCFGLVRLDCTPDLEIDHLYITRQCQIRAVCPIGKREPYLSLPVIEQFIRDVCGCHRERIRRVLDGANIWDLPISAMYRSLIETFHLEATDEDIRRELIVRTLDQRNAEGLSRWVRELRRQAGRILTQMRSQPRFADLSHFEHMAWIVRAIAASQQRLGWLSCVPPTLAEDIMVSEPII